ncbi:hypothetical protein QQP08_004304 [Theobroma cacao]|nr:hypothetical protein QQP08_004304 [Theobroma cacao]
MNEVSRGLGLAKAMILLWHRASSDLEAALEGCNTDRCGEVKKNGKGLLLENIHLHRQAREKSDILHCRKCAGPRVQIHHLKPMISARTMTMKRFNLNNRELLDEANKTMEEAKFD